MNIQELIGEMPKEILLPLDGNLEFKGTCDLEEMKTFGMIIFLNALAYASPYVPSSGPEVAPEGGEIEYLDVDIANILVWDKATEINIELSKEEVALLTKEIEGRVIYAI